MDTEPAPVDDPAVPPHVTPPEDRVVLLADDGTAIGTAPRATVHGADTPLHLAFSCYLFRPDGTVLLTRRAAAKRSWPGVWTNAFCGHPRPGEPLEDAVRRHARHELGVEVSDVTVVLPDFRYRARDLGGVVENEICPVVTAWTAEDLAPNPDEVMDHRWVTPSGVGTAVTVAPWAVSPWMVEQVVALTAAGGLVSADHARSERIDADHAHHAGVTR